MGASEDLTQQLFSRPQAPAQRALGEVVAVLSGDELFARHGDRILRLDHLDIAGHPRREAVAGLRQLLRRQIAGLPGDGELL